MKRLVLLLALVFTYSVFSQSYDIVAVESMGLSIKFKGKLHITDSLFIVKSKEGNVDYDIINERNGVIYVSDGVVTSTITITNKDGKKKRKLYDNILYFSTSSNGNNLILVYYLKEED